MKRMLWVLILLTLTACSKEDLTTTTQGEGDANEALFLNYGEEPSIEMKLIDMDGATDIALNIINKKRVNKSVEVMGNPAERTEIDQFFYTTLCNQPVFVVVVRQWISTYESGGWFNYNVVINTKNGSLINVIEAGDEAVKADGSVILMRQKQVIDDLKAGKQINTICE